MFDDELETLSRKIQARSGLRNHRISVWRDCADEEIAREKVADNLFAEGEYRKVFESSIPPARKRP